MTHYFAIDGNWGDANGLLVVDTSSWTEAMLEAMDTEIDRYKVDLARHFSAADHDWEELYCNKCELSKAQCGIKE